MCVTHKSSGIPLCGNKKLGVCKLSQLWQFLFSEKCTHTQRLKTSALSDKDTHQGSCCRATDKLKTKYFLSSQPRILPIRTG